jgi:hypothetical protein
MQRTDAAPDTQDAATSAQRTRIGATVLGSQAKDFPSFSAYAGGVAQRLHQDAQLGIVQAVTQNYVDTVKLLLAAGGRVDAKRCGFNCNSTPAN